LTTKMLASTVQFSSYGRSRYRVAACSLARVVQRGGGPGLSRRAGAAGPSGPNSVRRNCDLRCAFHSAPRCGCTCERRRSAQLVSVPPLSNHLETFARAVALHAGYESRREGAP